MKLVEIIIYIYLLLRPYYFFESGTLQISDFVFLLGFLLFILFSLKNKNMLIESIKKNIYYLLFLICVFIINFVYYFVYFDNGFIISSLYYLFNFLIIIVFSHLIKNDKFLMNVNKIMKLNLILQLLVFIIGVGDYWRGTYRYMGTFNDPNQFAYFILMMYSFIYLLEIKLKIKNNLLLYFIISLFLVFLSSSTGMLLGFTAFGILMITDCIKEISTIVKKNLKLFVFACYFLLVIITLFLIKPNYFYRISNFISNAQIISRVEEKINKTQDDDYGLLYDRGYDVILKYPKYLLYGAGQGKYIRFSGGTNRYGEIHATLPSILFYYGILPTIFLLIWVYKNIKGLKFKSMIAYIALFLESFTLLNQRQALFWIIILLGSILKESRKKDG